MAPCTGLASDESPESVGDAVVSFAPVAAMWSLRKKRRHLAERSYSLVDRRQWQLGCGRCLWASQTIVGSHSGRMCGVSGAGASAEASTRGSERWKLGSAG